MIPARNCQPRPAPVAPNYSPQPPPSFLQRDLVPRKLGPELTQTKSLGGAVRHAEASRPGAPNAIRGLACPPSLPASCCWWFITLLGGYFFFFFFHLSGSKWDYGCAVGVTGVTGAIKGAWSSLFVGPFSVLEWRTRGICYLYVGFPNQVCSFSFPVNTQDSTNCDCLPLVFRPFVRLLDRDQAAFCPIASPITGQPTSCW